MLRLRPAAPVKVKEAGRRLSQTPAPIDSFQQPEDFISSAQSLRQHSLLSSPLTQQLTNRQTGRLLLGMKYWEP